jgi:hypothetical protein
MSGGYPGATKYSVRAHGTDFAERTASGEPYPVGDDRPDEGTFEQHIEADELIRDHSGMFYPEEFENDDLLHYKMGGGPGFGDPLSRSVEQLKEDVEGDIFTPDIVESVYGVVGDYDADAREFTVDEEATEARREEMIEERKAQSQSFEEFFEEERARVEERDWNEGVQWMYEGVFELSEDWAEEFRGFWNLDAEFTP